MIPCGWSFDNSYARLPEVLFTRLAPSPVRDPRLVILNEPLGQRLGLNFSSMSSQALAELFAGNRLPTGADPLAQAYAGHQFGHFTMLGDGRAIVLGEQMAPDGKRFDIQFKGSGRTPYSRNGDGRAALGPMLREYIISEALHALGIPTTRSLAVVTTGEWVFRGTPLAGAILTRVASSHLRVGTFQYLAMRRETGVLNRLVDYALERHYPSSRGGNAAMALLSGVMERQAALVIEWLRVGFVHGVMNTDNMAISGESIDFGPCAFMDVFQRGTVFSSIDQTGRYAFANQPGITQWNCARFAESLLPLLHPDPVMAAGMAQEAIDGLASLLQTRWLSMMRAKLGLAGEEAGDAGLIGDLLDWMEERSADYTRTFRSLAAETLPDDSLFRDAPFLAWQRRWLQRLEANPGGRKAGRAHMLDVNPAVIPRNHKVEEAINAAVLAEELTPLHDLLAALAHPYEDQPSLEPYTRLPESAQRVYKTFCGT
ncbi:MAG: YdiU family protein [Magnetococcales bacterium]|nr:YdiU family protein [Magnetococcales bacterium]MBF0156862.1 YdiU family protein [Magnetococcales bacterium]